MVLFVDLQQCYRDGVWWDIKQEGKNMRAMRVKGYGWVGGWIQKENS